MQHNPSERGTVHCRSELWTFPTGYFQTDDSQGPSVTVLSQAGPEYDTARQASWPRKGDGNILPSPSSFQGRDCNSELSRLRFKGNHPNFCHLQPKQQRDALLPQPCPRALGGNIWGCVFVLAAVRALLRGRPCPVWPLGVKGLSISRVSSRSVSKAHSMRSTLLNDPKGQIWNPIS